MDLLLVQKEGVDLHATLLASDTSRAILRFYRPKKLDYGVLITSSSLGGTLSLLSELNWYIRRYVAEVLVEIAEGRFGTSALAHDIYHRDVVIREPWEFQRRIGIKSDAALESYWIDPDTDGDDPHRIADAVRVLDVWCSKREFEESR